jgi:thymidylate kinase
MTIVQSERPADPVPAEPGPIPALVGLLEECLAAARFCSWKSNEHLLEGLAGRTDLDLLVAREDAAAFREVLDRHGLKRLRPAAGADYPAMEHFLGIDLASGRLFHLHVHTQLVLGEHNVKNHRIPLEEAFLASVQLQDGVPVPARELELAILSVRALLKYRPRDAVKDVLKIRTPGLKSPVRAELDWLLDRATPDAVRTALESTGDIVPAEDVVAFLTAYRRDPRAGATLWRLRRRIRADLRHAQRSGRVAAAGAAWRGFRADRVRRRRPWEHRMTPASGGLTVAVIGADGSGKSTVTEELRRWLAWKVSVRGFYLGSKAPSAASRGSYLVFRAFRRAGTAVGPPLAERFPLATGRDLALAAHHLANARDRARRERQGRRDAAAGRVVLFDRFPLTALDTREDLRVLDGPKIAAFPRAGRSPLLRRLAAAEERRYAGMRLPDHVVVLQVEPDVALARKPDHHRAAIEAKSAAAREAAALIGARLGADRVSTVDAAMLLDEVLRTTKARLWDVL